jgi:hypothetical protein
MSNTSVAVISIITSIRRLRLIPPRGGAAAVETTAVTITADVVASHKTVRVAASRRRGERVCSCVSGLLVSDGGEVCLLCGLWF